MEYEKIVSDFILGKKFKVGNFVSNGKTLIALRVKKSFGNIVEFRELIAHKFDSEIIANASTLEITKELSRKVWNKSVHPIQQIFETRVTMLPLYQFQSMGLDLSKLVMLESGKFETVKVKTGTRYNKETDKHEDAFTNRHFMGARLFDVDGKTYIFDIDRNEIKHNIFNAFLVELPETFKGKTIEQAYASLIPEEVKTAIVEQKEVHRQGEWFFIKDRLSTAGEMIEPRGGELRAGPNRPNYTERKLKDVNLVSGLVKHAGREHKELQLDNNYWYRAVPNTAQKSFTITGDID